MKLSNVFITGCDQNTEWMLPWFYDNISQHSKTKMLVYDFGMSDEMKRMFAAIPLKGNEKGWFKKPRAMQEAGKLAEKVCWLDTDCQVLGPIDEIFNHIEPNKLAMVEDKPWSIRRQEKWHNSGVVAFQSTPNILDEWVTAVAHNPKVGDQEVLHDLVKGGMRRMIHITDLPRKYNTLRLDLQDNTAPASPVVMHWTGPKGKAKIQEFIHNERKMWEFNQ